MFLISFHSVCCKEIDKKYVDILSLERLKILYTSYETCKLYVVCKGKIKVVQNSKLHLNQI